MFVSHWMLTRHWLCYSHIIRPHECFGMLYVPTVTWGSPVHLLVTVKWFPVNGFQETGLCPSLVGILCCIRTSFSTKVIRSGTTRFDLLFWHTQIGHLCASVRFITVFTLSSVGPILNQLNTVNHLRIHSCLIHFSSILSWTPMSPEGSRPLCFPVRTEYHLMYHIWGVYLILIG
jgi:hypothetical protein